MSALHDKLQSVFGKVFRGQFDSGTLHKVTSKTRGPNKSHTYGFTDYPIFLQRDSWDEGFDPALPRKSTELRFLILNEGLSGVVVDADDEITHRGQRYKIEHPVNRDPVEAYFDVRCIAKPSG